MTYKVVEVADIGIPEGSSLSELVGELQEALASVPEEYKALTSVEIYSNDESDDRHCYITYRRVMTPEEQSQHDLAIAERDAQMERWRAERATLRRQTTTPPAVSKPLI